MEAHRMTVVIPEDHRLELQVPEEIRSGPVELIFLVPAETQAAATEPRRPDPRAVARLEKLDAELAQDPRSFKELSPVERQERLRQLRGIGRGLLSSSEEFARRKREELELEERQLG